MTDIVCPSCQARYRLPEGTIGEKGRRVSCSACGHTWHAYPEPEERPLMLGPEVAAEPAGKPDAGPAGGPVWPHAVETGPGGPADESARSGGPEEAGYNPRSEEEDRGMAAYEAFARDQEEDEGTGGAGEAAPDRIAPGPDPFGRQEELADDRAKQMAQIRSMLDEIKESPREAGPAAPPAAEPMADPDRPSEGLPPEEEPAPAPPPRPGAVERSLREVEEEERDPLRARLAQYEKPRGSGDVGQARGKMLKQHAKKVRRRKIDEKRGSGTFLTGFLLVVLVVSVMAALYLLNPLIVERFPETEPAMRDYVETMDAFRVWVGEQVETGRTWAEDMLSRL